MRYIKIKGIEYEIPIFDDEKLCQKCSCPLDAVGCHSCAGFYSKKKVTGGKYYFNKIFSVGNYYLNQVDNSNSLYNLNKLILSFKGNEKFIPPCAELLKIKILDNNKELNISKEGFIICSVPDSELKPYQKAKLLASQLSKIIDIPFFPILKKIKENKKQHRVRNIEEKSENIKDVFSIDKNLLKVLKNKKVLLVDDIITTVLTANECSRILKENGAREIFIFSIGRSISPPKNKLEEEKK